MNKIAIIEHNKALRENYLDYFSMMGKLNVLWSADSIDDVLVNTYDAPRVLLLDLNLLNINTEGYSILKQKYPNTNIVIISRFDINDSENDLIERGVDGYLIESMNLSEIHKKIESFIDCTISEITNKNDCRIALKLTNREHEIVKLISEGLSYVEASERLLITAYTINQHLKNIYKKLGVNTKRELILKMINGDEQ